MAPLTHLADTSALTRLRIPSVYKELRVRIQARTIGRTHVVDLEYAAGARNGTEWDERTGAMEILPLVPVEHADFVAALITQRALAARGLRGRPLPDLLVAATADRTGLIILHYDHDFDLISQVTGQPNEWVAERGSID